MNIFWMGSLAAAAFWQHGADIAMLRDIDRDNARRHMTRPTLARVSIVTDYVFLLTATEPTGTICDRKNVCSQFTTKHLKQINSWINMQKSCFFLSDRYLNRCTIGCVVECWICNWEVAGSNRARGYFAPRSTQPSIPLWSVNEYQLWLGRQRQVWLIPIADEHVGVQVKL